MRVALPQVLAALALAGRLGLSLLVLDDDFDPPVGLQAALPLRKFNSRRIRAARRSAVDAPLSSAFAQDSTNEHAGGR